MNEDDEVRTVWIGNLSQKVSEEVLFELFLQAAPLQRVKIPKDKDGKQCNFAFVTFKHQSSVLYATELLNGIELYNQALNIKPRNSSVNQNQIRACQQLRFPQALNNDFNRSPKLNPYMNPSKNYSYTHHVESRKHSNNSDYQERRRFNDSPYSRPHGDNYHNRYDRRPDRFGSNNDKNFNKRKHRHHH